MLDQLVESKSNSRENKRRSAFLGGVLIIVVSALLGGLTYSLFAKSFDMGDDELNLTSLVAPVAVADEEPPPKVEKQPQKEPDVDVRKELIQNIESSPVKPPDVISTAPSKIPQMRLNTLTKVGSADTNTGADFGKEGGRVVENGGTGSLSTGTGNEKTGGTEGEEAPPPPPKKAPPKTVSGGVLNGKATSLPKPAYPAAAKAIRAGGAVSVQVLIDESGRVVSASAVSGHPLLRAAAVAAAQGARFSPTLLSGQPVKVSGVITYNFVAP
jgi:protein TonB